MLGAVLDAYRLDNGRYPTTAQGLAALWQAPAQGPRPTDWKGPYLRKEVPLDRWGRPYSTASVLATATVLRRTWRRGGGGDQCGRWVPDAGCREQRPAPDTSETSVRPPRGQL